MYETCLRAIGYAGRFYRQPIKKDAHGNVRYSNQANGINTLGLYMKYIFNEAGIDHSDRHITGHSGNVTSCTRLCTGGFDEQTIKSASDYRSDAVRQYKRPSTTITQAISSTLQPPKPKCTTTTTEQTASPRTSNPNSQPSRDITSWLLSRKYLRMLPTQVTSSPTTTAMPTQVCDTSDALIIKVPDCVKKIIIEKNGKRMTFEI